MFLLDSVLQQVTGDCLLTPQQLKRLAEHKYSATDISFLDQLCMQKFWSWLVLKYPVWLAPNLITLIGFICNISAVLLLYFYSPTGQEPAPRWAYFLCAVTLFVYQAMDATDGKQARRTNSSSPLGELFDHGCDSLSQMFVSLQVCLSVQLGYHPIQMLYLCLTAVGIFYCAHWQTYVCGSLKFDKFDVTEAQFCVMVVCLMSAVFGPEMWSMKMLYLELKLILIYGSGVLVFLQMGGYLSTVFTGGVGKNGSTVADTSILFPLFPLLLIVMPPAIIYHKSETGAFQENLVLYCLFIGCISSKITNRLVIAHMSKSEFSLWDSILIGPALLIVNQYFNTWIPEFPLLAVCFLFIFNRETNLYPKHLFLLKGDTVQARTLQLRSTAKDSKLKWMGFKWLYFSSTYIAVNSQSRNKSILQTSIFSEVRHWYNHAHKATLDRKRWLMKVDRV